MKDEVLDLFNIGDPIEYWAQQACKFSGELRIASEFVTEVIAIIKGAFSEEWLRKLFTEDSKGRPIFQRIKHPLHTIFTTPSHSQIIELYELAIYIKRLIACPNICKVIEMMKTQYEEGLLQLAFGYRFLRLGAKHIAFEPEATGGKYGDIYSELDGVKYMVECYRPSRSATQDTSKELLHCISPIFRAAESIKKTLRVCIKMKKSINARERKEIQSMIIKAIKEHSEFNGLQVENEFAMAVIDDIGDMEQDNDFIRLPTALKLYGDAHCGFRSSKIPADKKLIQLIRDGKHEVDKGGNRILIWRPDSEKIKPPLRDEASVIASKIERKLCQTRRANEGVRRIIIAEIPEGRQVSMEKDSRAIYICERIQRKIIGGHSNISALFLCKRTWTMSMRYKYMGVVLSGKARDALSSDFIDRLNEIEGRTDWLEDWR